MQADFYRSTMAHKEAMQQQPDSRDGRFAPDVQHVAIAGKGKVDIMRCLQQVGSGHCLVLPALRLGSLMGVHLRAAGAARCRLAHAGKDSTLSSLL